MRAHLSSDLVKSISLATWHALFGACGYPAGITPKTTSLDAIAAALRDGDHEPALARAIFVIPAFATEAGRSDIYGAARALGYGARWPHATSPADLIALLLAASVKDAAVDELLSAAKIVRNRSFRPYSTLLFAGRSKAQTNMGEPSQYVDAWKTALAPLLASFDFGAVTDVHLCVAPGRVTYEIVHEGRPEATVTAASGSTVARPLRSHSVAYASASKRLWITTNNPELAMPLARLAGQLFFDDEQHFLDSSAVDLRPLQERGEKALERTELLRKLTVTAVGGTWHSGKNHAMTPRGKYFFRALARYKIRIEGGRLELITLRANLTPDGDGPLECDVVLRPPHLVTVSEPEAEGVLHEFLDAAEITRPKPLKRDFFVDQPWIDILEHWTKREGVKGFRLLLAKGVLEADASNRAVAPPGNPSGGRTAMAYPLANGKYLAWSSDPTVAPFVVDEKDLVVFKLKFGKLAKMVSRRLKLEDAADALDDDGVLALGHRMIGATRFYLFLLTRPIRKATEKRLTDAAGTGHAVLILPRARFENGALREIAMPKVSGPWHPLLGEIVRTFHIESSVETPLYAPPSARLVMHRETRRVWVDGVLCSALSELQTRMVEYWLDHAGQVMHTKDIAAYVGQDEQHVDTTRQTMKALWEAVERSFAETGKAAPGDLKKFVKKPLLGRYVLGVRGFVA